MKTLGLVGGIGPESTIEYYRFILDGCRARLGEGGAAPHLIIDSIDVNRGIAFLDAQDYGGLAGYISESVARLARAGAEVGLMAANTPHIVFDEVQERSPIPLISIVEAARAKVASMQLDRVALLGTGFTMRGEFYPRVFGKIAIVTPDEGERQLIHRAYIDELLKNNFRDETRAAILRIIERLRDEEQVRAVLLAGTELPLLLRGAEPDGVTFIDTTLVHVAAAVDAIVA